MIQSYKWQSWSDKPSPRGASTPGTSCRGRGCCQGEDKKANGAGHRVSKDPGIQEKEGTGLGQE